MTFESVDAAKPAKFYFNSTTAHRNYPDKKGDEGRRRSRPHGFAGGGSNERNINKMIVNQVLPHLPVADGA